MKVEPLHNNFVLSRDMSVITTHEFILYLNKCDQNNHEKTHLYGKYFQTINDSYFKRYRHHALGFSTT